MIRLWWEWRVRSLVWVVGFTRKSLTNWWWKEPRTLSFWMFLNLVPGHEFERERSRRKALKRILDEKSKNPDMIHWNPFAPVASSGGHALRRYIRCHQFGLFFFFHTSWSRRSFTLHPKNTVPTLIYFLEHCNFLYSDLGEKKWRIEHQGKGTDQKQH